MGPAVYLEAYRYWANDSTTTWMQSEYQHISDAVVMPNINQSVAVAVMFNVTRMKQTPCRYLSMVYQYSKSLTSPM